MMQRQAQAGILSFGLVIFDLAVLLTGSILGKLADTWSKRWLIFWGMFVFSVFAILLGFHFGILFIIFGFLATTGDEMANVSLWAWLDHLDKEHAEDGLITGVLILFEDFGWMVGPIIAGLLFETYDPTWTIVTGGCLIFTAWIASTYLLWRSDLSTFGPRLRQILQEKHFPQRHRHKH